MDKIVVITGASGGIGAALAVEVGRRGGKPVLAARREKELREVAGRCGGEVVVTDVTKRHQVERLRDEAIRRCGGIDVWVNNAGRGISKQVAELTDQDFDEMMLVNTKSALYGMQTALKHFKERKRGHIINITSMLGRMPVWSPRAAYSASKFALNSLTINLRVDLKAQFPDIHVSSVYPGVVATDFGKNAKYGGPDSRSFSFAQQPEEIAVMIADLIERPRAELYTRDVFREQIAQYYGAVDVAVLESKPPWVRR
jgi:short-subunit dehydrogenase